MREMHTAKYAKSSRALHWITFVLIAVQLPVGLYMAWRGVATNFDALTNTLYSWHKLVGMIILMIIAARIVIRARHPAPALPDHIPQWQAAAAHGLHYAIYALLVLVPLLGWAGVTAYPALVTVGGFNLPPLPFVPQNPDLAARLFQWHGYAAFTLLLLVAAHFAAAMKHLLIDRDGVFQRIWFDRKA